MHGQAGKEKQLCPIPHAETPTLVQARTSAACLQNNSSTKSGFARASEVPGSKQETG